jgi:two-component system nitrate/nitrite response regulator NarL
VALAVQDTLPQYVWQVTSSRGCSLPSPSAIANREAHWPRVLISDKTLLGCQLLATSLAGHVADTGVSAVACSSEEILRVAHTTNPEVALISAALSDGPLAGFKALPVLQSLFPHCSVVVLLDANDPDLVVDAFRARARGVFFRADPMEHLIKCIECVYRGEVWIASRDLRLVLDAFSECSPFHSSMATDPNLTKREFDIANLVAAAQTNRQISRRLNLSEHTVKNYLFRIFEKVGVGSRVELAVHMMNLNQNARSMPADLRRDSS